MLGSFIGRWATVLASKSRSSRVWFGGELLGRVLLAHGERRGTSAAKRGPHVSLPGRRCTAERRGKGRCGLSWASGIPGPRAGAGYGWGFCYLFFLTLSNIFFQSLFKESFECK